MSESKKQGQILKALEVIGCYAVKIVVANRSGTHDIVTCCRGRFYSIEVKAATGVTSALQLKKRKQVTDAGGKAIVTKTIKDAINMIKEDWKERGLIE